MTAESVRVGTWNLSGRWSTAHLNLFTARPPWTPLGCAVGRLVADTFTRFNLAFASDNLAIVLVAEDEGDVVGVLRGRSERLARLFVSGDHHRCGIGRQLVAARGGSHPLGRRRDPPPGDRPS